MWTRNYIFFFWNWIYGGFKKLVLRLHELFLNPEQSWLSDNERILDHFWRSQKKNWCHILKSVLKVAYVMQTQN